MPTDLDDCLAHAHGDYGWHYHAGFDGEVGEPTALSSLACLPTALYSCQRLYLALYITPYLARHID